MITGHGINVIAENNKSLYIKTYRGINQIVEAGFDDKTNCNID